MRLAHTMIRVRDLDATRSFYEGVIGLQELRRKSIGSEAPLGWLGDGEGGFGFGGIAGTGHNPAFVATGDFDFDGTADLAVARLVAASTRRRQAVR